MPFLDVWRWLPCIALVTVELEKSIAHEMEPRFTNDQIQIWQEFLTKNVYPNEADLKYLSSKLGLSPKVIDTWFLTRQKLSETTFDIDLDSIDSVLPWLQTTKNILPEPTSSIPWPSATAAAVSTDTFNSSVISPDPPRTNVSRVYPVKKAQLSPTLNIESVRGSGNSEAGAAIPELITDEKVIQKSGKQTCWDILYFKTHQLS